MDECTKAEMGVGAAMAMGNQAEKGNCALFEHAAIIIRIKDRFENSEFIEKFQFDVINIILIDIKIRMSPVRLDRSVMDPEALDIKFW